MPKGRLGKVGITPSPNPTKNEYILNAHLDFLEKTMNYICHDCVRGTTLDEPEIWTSDEQDENSQKLAKKHFSYFWAIFQSLDHRGLVQHLPATFAINFALCPALFWPNCSFLVSTVLGVRSPWRQATDVKHHNGCEPFFSLQHSKNARTPNLSQQLLLGFPVRGTRICQKFCQSLSENCRFSNFDQIFDKFQSP